MLEFTMRTKSGSVATAWASSRSAEPMTPKRAVLVAQTVRRPAGVISAGRHESGASSASANRRTADFWTGPFFIWPRAYGDLDAEFERAFLEI